MRASPPTRLPANNVTSNKRSSSRKYLFLLLIAGLGLFFTLGSLRPSSSSPLSVTIATSRNGVSSSSSRGGRRMMSLLSQQRSKDSGRRENNKNEKKFIVEEEKIEDSSGVLAATASAFSVFSTTMQHQKLIRETEEQKQGGGSKIKSSKSSEKEKEKEEKEDLLRRNSEDVMKGMLSRIFLSSGIDAEAFEKRVRFSFVHHLHPNKIEEETYEMQIVEVFGGGRGRQKEVIGECGPDTLVIQATTPVAAAYGMHQVLKKFLNISVTWGARHTGIHVPSSVKNLFSERSEKFPSGGADSDAVGCHFSWLRFVKGNPSVERITAVEKEEERKKDDGGKKKKDGPWMTGPVLWRSKACASIGKYRYYYNVCTFGYTTAFWHWNEWEREIDWMALHGINLPLAFIGQEHIWLKLWTSLAYNMTVSEVLSHFVGPGFYPWHWMGNLQRWAGPVDRQWIERRRQLQHQILKRMTEYGMSPVLPAFAGHIPKVLALRLEASSPSSSSSEHADNGEFSSSKTKSVRWSSLWMGFNEQNSGMALLDPLNPRFAQIGSDFMRLQTEEYGVVKYYNGDTFNEMIPQRTDGAYLAAAGKSVVAGIQAIVPQGKWLVQGWLFLHHRHIWSSSAIKSYLDGAGKGNVMVLDLASDILEVWEKRNAFHGHDFIWCMLHNFGGRRGIYGDVGTGLEKIWSAAQKGGRITWNENNFKEHEEKQLFYDKRVSFQGVGLTMEAIHHNPLAYEAVTDTFFLPMVMTPSPHRDFQHQQSSGNPSSSSSLLLVSPLSNSMLMKNVIISNNHPQEGDVTTISSSSFSAAHPSSVAAILPEHWRETEVLPRSVLLQMSSSSDYSPDGQNPPIRQLPLYLYQWLEEYTKSRYSSPTVQSAFHLFFSRISVSPDGNYGHPVNCCPSWTSMAMTPSLNIPEDRDEDYSPSLFLASYFDLITKLMKVEKKTEHDEKTKSEKEEVGEEDSEHSSLRYDLVDLQRQVLENYFMELHAVLKWVAEMTKAMKYSRVFAKYQEQEGEEENEKKKNSAAGENDAGGKHHHHHRERSEELQLENMLKDSYLSVKSRMLACFSRMKKLLSCDPNFRLRDMWTDPSAGWASEEGIVTSDDDEKQNAENSSPRRANTYHGPRKEESTNELLTIDKMLFNAKNLITLWGDRQQGYPNYAAKGWDDLYTEVYQPRWESFFSMWESGTLNEAGSLFGMQYNSEVLAGDWRWCVNATDASERRRKNQKKSSHQQKRKQVCSIHQILAQISSFFTEELGVDMDLDDDNNGMKFFMEEEEIEIMMKKNSSSSSSSEEKKSRNQKKKKKKTTIGGGRKKKKHAYLNMLIYQDNIAASYDPLVKGLTSWLSSSSSNHHHHHRQNKYPTTSVGKSSTQNSSPIHDDHDTKKLREMFDRFRGQVLWHRNAGIQYWLFCSRRQQKGMEAKEGERGNALFAESMHHKEGGDSLPSLLQMLLCGEFVSK